MLQRKFVLRYALIALSVVLGAVLHFGNFDSYEAPYVASLQQAVLNANAMWFFQDYSHLGDSIVWIGLALLLLAFDFRRPRKALKFALFIAVVAAVVFVLRFIFPRQRPFAEFPSTIQGLAPELVPSYPSGHVAPAAGGFFLLAARRKSQYLIADYSRVLNVVFGAMVFLLAVSRVAIGAHYFTDVIGAALISYPIAAIINDMKFFERFKER